jgi:hypothetical protein
MIMMVPCIIIIDILDNLLGFVCSTIFCCFCFLLIEKINDDDHILIVLFFSF